MNCLLAPLLEDHAHVVQPRNKAAAIDLGAAARAVAEADDVGTVLRKSALEGEALGVVGEGDEPGLPVVVVAHQDGELAARIERACAIGDELPVAVEEGVKRRTA